MRKSGREGREQRVGVREEEAPNLSLLLLLLVEGAARPGLGLSCDLILDEGIGER